MCEELIWTILSVPRSSLMVLAQRPGHQGLGCTQYSSASYPCCIRHIRPRTRSQHVPVARKALQPLNPLRVAQSQAYGAVDYSHSLVYWQRLRAAATSAADDAAVAASHPLAVAEHWLHQQVSRPLAATAVAVPESANRKVCSTCLAINWLKLAAVGLGHNHLSRQLQP